MKQFDMRSINVYNFKEYKENIRKVSIFPLSSKQVKNIKRGIYSPTHTSDLFENHTVT